MHVMNNNLICKFVGECAALFPLTMQWVSFFLKRFFILCLNLVTCFSFLGKKYIVYCYERLCVTVMPFSNNYVMNNLFLFYVRRGICINKNVVILCLILLVKEIFSPTKKIIFSAQWVLSSFSLRSYSNPYFAKLMSQENVIFSLICFSFRLTEMLICSNSGKISEFVNIDASNLYSIGYILMVSFINIIISEPEIKCTFNIL